LKVGVVPLPESDMLVTNGIGGTPRTSGVIAISVSLPFVIRRSQESTSPELKGMDLTKWFG